MWEKTKQKNNVILTYFSPLSSWSIVFSPPIKYKEGRNGANEAKQSKIAVYQFFHPEVQHRDVWVSVRVSLLKYPREETNTLSINVTFIVWLQWKNIASLKAFLPPSHALSLQARELERISSETLSPPSFFLLFLISLVWLLPRLQHILLSSKVIPKVHYNAYIRRFILWIMKDLESSNLCKIERNS